MSKRGATGDQGSRENPNAILNNLPSPDIPTRADASTLANRKILAGKRRRTPGSPGPSNAADALGNIFGGSPSSTMNNNSFSQNTFGSGFGQPPASPVFGNGNTSQSFPPANNQSTFGGSVFGASSSQNTFGTSQVGNKTAFSSAPASSGFSFGGTSTNIFSQPQPTVNNDATPAFGQSARNNGSQSFSGFGQSNGGASNNDSAMQISPEVTPSKNTENRPAMFDASFGHARTGTGNLFGQLATNVSIYATNDKTLDMAHSNGNNSHNASQSTAQPVPVNWRDNRPKKLHYGDKPPSLQAQLTIKRAYEAAALEAAQRAEIAAQMDLIYKNSSTNMFTCQQNTSTQTSGNMFASQSTSAEQKTAPSFSFGQTQTPAKSVSNATASSPSFNFTAGAASTPNGTSTNSFKFGSATPQAPAPSPVSFGTSNVITAPKATTEANSFKGFNAAAGSATTIPASNPFTTLKPATAAMPAVPSAATPFSTFNAAVGNASTAPPVASSFGALQPAAAAGSPFNLFKPVAASASNEPVVNPFNTFKPAASTTSTGPTNPLNNANQSRPSTNSYPQSSFGSAPNFFAAPNLASPPATPPTLSSQTPPTEAPRFSFGNLTTTSTTPDPSISSTVTSSNIATSPPKQAGNVLTASTDTQSQVYKAHLELQSLNQSYRKMLATIDASLDWAPLMHAYISQQAKIVGLSNPGSVIEGTKRKAADDISREDEKRMRSNDSPQSSPQKAVNDKSQTVNLFQSILDNGSGRKDTNDENISIGAAPNAFQSEAQDSIFANASVLSTKNPESQAVSNPFANLKASSAASVFKPTAPSTNSALTSPFTTGTTTKNHTSTNMFMAKPTEKVSVAAAAPVPKPPTFGSGGAPVNFLAQFGQNAQKTAAEEKAKRKAEDFDSDEDDENEWEEKYEEEQRQKKEKLAEESKKAAKFVPGGPAKTGASAAPVNFLAQFGQNAQKTAAEEKAKRKADEFDSDEDDEAEWERQDAEKQRQKKAKLEKDSQAKGTRFVPGKGFVFEEAGEATSTTNFQTSTDSSESAAPASVFSSTAPRSQASAANNIFAGLADKPSGSAGSNSDDGDDDVNEPFTSQQDSENDTLEDAMRKPNGTKTKSMEVSGFGKSLFDRTSADKSETLTKSKSSFSPGDSSGGVSNPALSSSNIFGFGDKTSPAADHTWKVDSPIKFGTSANPTFTVEAATPTKATMFTASNSTTPAGKPVSTLFGTTRPDTGKALFGQPSSTPFGSLSSQSGSTGFTFTQPTQASTTFSSPFLFPPTASEPPSNTTSRATSPGTDSAAMDSATEIGADGDAEKPLAQTEFTGLSEAEKRDEDLSFEVKKALCKQFVPATSFESAKWENKGTGPFRVLKHKETGVARIVMRAAPSGRVVINSRVLKDTENTQRSAKIMQFMALGTDGDLQTWTAQFGKAEDAIQLKAVLDDNKPT